MLLLLLYQTSVICTYQKELIVDFIWESYNIFVEFYKTLYAVLDII